MRYRRHEVEACYARLRNATEPVDWKGRPFHDFDLREFLDEVLPTLSFGAGEPRAFEYGTGTGPGACYLAERGFHVDAIDTSPSAIELALSFAARRGLEIAFAVADVTQLDRPGRKYDLVVDNFCLHNLITDEERRRTLALAQDLLRPGGYFVVGTSVFRPDRNYGGDIRDEESGIVYRRLESAGDFEDEVTIDGTSYYARVRHLSFSRLREELEAAGFRIVHQNERGRLLCKP